jgi:glycerol-3-phosphate acyltransferase PlsX
MSDNSINKKQTITIALDCMGGDKGVHAVIPGAARAAKQMPNVSFLLFGRKNDIQSVLVKYPKLENRCEIVHCDDVVAGDDKPSAALRSGRKSSMRLAINAVSEGRADCIVSSGNTGALMAMAKLVLKCLPGIHRPAIASLIPTVRGSTLVLDLGANLTCNEDNYIQFMILGAVYAKAVLGISSPTAGLLNIGTEDTKGHEMLQMAKAILAQVEMPGEFKGFVEGDDIGKGTVDVIVTDGFTGNVALKTAEGIGHLFRETLQDAFGKSLFGRLAYLLAYKPFSKVKKRLDHRVYNGGLFLGLNGVCIKSHGSADDYAFSHAVIAGAKMVENGFNTVVANEIKALENQKQKHDFDELKHADISEMASA